MDKSKKSERLKKSVIGMGIGLGCVYGSLMMVIVGIFVFFGTLVGARGIFGFVTESGFSGATLILFLLWLIAIVSLFGGFIAAFGFWVYGLPAFTQTNIDWYIWVDVGVFLISLVFIGVIGVFMLPIPWWVTHFIGYRKLVTEEQPRDDFSI